VTDFSVHNDAMLQKAFEALGFIDTDKVCWLPDCGCVGEAHE